MWRATASKARTPFRWVSRRVMARLSFSDDIAHENSLVHADPTHLASRLIRHPKRAMLDLDTTRRRTDHPGFTRMFRPGQLSLGVFFPIEAFEGDRPTMRDQVALARRAERAGFAALWFR